MDITSFIKQCTALARSVRIYHSTVGKQVLNYYQLNRSGWLDCEDMEDTPYIKHLRGLSALTDAAVTMTSIDTGLVFTLTTDFTAHPKTRQRLQVDNDYFLETALSLGEFGYERLTGFVYPYTGTIDLKNGTILGYDTSLVEQQEFILMADLQNWIYRSLGRWTNSGYIASDELYGAGIHGILYAHMPSQIVYLRNKYVLTQMAHSFHIDTYLADHNFGNVVNILSTKQKYSLYKHVPWLLENRGTQEAYLFYKQLLEMDPTVSVNEFWTQINPTEERVQIMRSSFDTAYAIPTSDMTILTGQSGIDIDMALQQGEVVDTLPVVSVQVTSHYGLFLPLKRVLLYAWGSYAERNIYVDTLQVELPDNSTRALTTKDAFKYYTIHRPMSHISQGYEYYLYILPFIQVVSGYTGEDLFNFIDISRIDRKLFPEYVERMYFDMIRLRTEVDRTRVDERVYWEGEFPRTYPNLLSLVPDKAEWLSEHSLPELTDEYLDKMYETFTGYSLTNESKSLGKAKAYRTMLRNSLSASVHVAEELDMSCHTAFTQCPYAGVVDCAQVPDAFQLKVVLYLDGGDRQYSVSNTLLTTIKVKITGYSGVLYDGTVSTGIIDLVVPSGDYTVEVTDRTGYLISPTGATTATATVLPSTGTITQTIAAHTTYYFGLFQDVPYNAKITGVVWLDTTPNTMWDFTETRPGNIDVLLINSYGYVIQTVKSAVSNGQYTFWAQPGTYTIQCIHPNGYAPTAYNAAAIGGNKLLPTGTTNPFTVAAAANVFFNLGFAP